MMDLAVTSADELAVDIILNRYRRIMYKKTSIKIDKRITKCLIAASVLIVATAPLLYNVVLAQQQPPKTADLTIENYVNAVNHCPAAYAAEHHCPEGSNTGMLTTITIVAAAGSGLPPTKIEFPAGPWGKQQILTPHPAIPIGRTYEITTRVPIPEYKFDSGYIPDYGPVHVTFRHVNTSIDGACRAGPDKTAHCESTMSDGGGTIKVTYNWSYTKA